MQRVRGDAIVGEARSYSELIEIFRRRVAALGCTLESIDETAGLPSRYCQKLLSSIRGLVRD